MAAAIKALNAKIRSNPYTDYICSTHFWGPVSNFGIPIAAVLDTQKDPEIISGKFTAALTLYSATFMRYSLAITPKNYLLFGCHLVNFGSQVTQGYRWYDYWYMDGRKRWPSGTKALNTVEGEAKGAVDAVKDKAAELTKKVS